MIREANIDDINEVRKLYLSLHEKDIPENDKHLQCTLNFYKQAGYNSTDKTAFIQWL